MQRSGSTVATQVRGAAAAAIARAADEDYAAVIEQPRAAALVWSLPQTAEQVAQLVRALVRAGMSLPEDDGADESEEELTSLKDSLVNKVPVALDPNVLERWRIPLSILERSAQDFDVPHEDLVEAGLWLLLLHGQDTSLDDDEDDVWSSFAPEDLSPFRAVLLLAGTSLFGGKFVRAFAAKLSVEVDEAVAYNDALEEVIGAHGNRFLSDCQALEAILDDCDWVGFDLDNTLVRYERSAAFATRYEAVVKHIKNGLRDEEDESVLAVLQQVPDELEEKYLWLCEKKCLVIDNINGFLLVVDANFRVIFGLLGSSVVSRKDFEEQDYFSEPLDLQDKDRFSVLHTEIEQPFAGVLAAFLDADERRADPQVRQAWTERIRDAFVFVQSRFCAFSFEAKLSTSPQDYVQARLVKVLPWLKKLVQKRSCKLFILTNSDWTHTQAVMNAAFGSGAWRSLFTLVVTSSSKSSFFVSTDSGNGIAPKEMGEDGVLSGGNAIGLAEVLGVDADDKEAARRVVYFGDHLEQDVRSPRNFGWTPVAIVEPTALTLLPGLKWPALAARLASDAQVVVPDLITVSKPRAASKDFDLQS